MFTFHIHYEESAKTDQIIETLSLIIKNQQTIMATQEQFAAALTRVEVATTKAGVAATAIGVRITSLEEIIKGLGLSAEVEAKLLAQTEGIAGGTEALATALEAMGKTPETPVPVPVPDPLPPVEG